MARKTTTISLEETTRHKAFYLGQELGYSTLSALLTHLINNEFEKKEVEIKKHNDNIFLT